MSRTLYGYWRSSASYMVRIALNLKGLDYETKGIDLRTGAQSGVGIARKHISWYTKGLVGSASFRHQMNQLPDTTQQRRAVDEFFARLGETDEHLHYLLPESGDNNNEGELAA